MFACGPSSTIEACYANVAPGFRLTLTATGLRHHRLVKWVTPCRGKKANCTTEVLSSLVAEAVFTSK